MDSKRQRAVEREDWIGTMTRMRVDLPGSLVIDLFEKVDTNKDGVLSFSEFQRFAEVYPTLLDSLYYRSKDYWTDIAQLESIEEAKAVYNDLREREHQVSVALHEVQVQRQEQEVHLAAAENALDEVQAREEEFKAAFNAAQHNTSRAKQRVAERNEELAGHRERERQCIHDLHDTQRDTQEMLERLKLQEADVHQAEERLRHVERMLLEHKRDLESKNAAREQAQSEVYASQAREQTAQSSLVEAQICVQHAVEQAIMADNEVAAFVEVEEQSKSALSGASAEVGKAQAKRDVELRDYHAAKDREAQSLVMQESARAATETQGHAIQALEVRNSEFNEHRRAVEAEEAPLLEQEALIREQRDNLDMREAQLRSDVHVFTAHSGRSPGSSPHGGANALMARQDALAAAAVMQHQQQQHQHQQAAALVAAAAAAA
eukprot:gene1141-1750_t